MAGRAGRGAGWFWGVGVVLAAVAAAGCKEDTAVPVAQNRVVSALVEPKLAMSALTLAAGSNPAPTTTAALADNVTVDARLLVITAGGTNAAFAAITTTLDYLGTPYDVFDASAASTMTADVLAAGDHGRYYGILLDTGDLAVGSASALSDAEWMALAEYEARFGVRRAVLYAIPTAAYGLQSTGGFDVRATPLTVNCTPAAQKVFVGANCWVPISVADGWAYGSQPTDAATVPLLVDAAGNVYAATRTYADGREALVLTFSQSPTALHTLGLIYGLVSWVTRGLFVGERHVYLSAQLDDFFLASVIYPVTGTTYRCTAADLQAFASWQNTVQGDPVTTHFRAAFAFNAHGARPAGQDPLTDKARELGPTFAWINHTWDHADLNPMAYAAAFEEFSKNHQYALGGLSPYSVENLVTPGISGLDNPEVMRAAFDVGIRQLVSDTTKPGQNNPSPNAGYYNAQVPALLTIPRRATDLYFNVSQPAEWVAEYGALQSGTFTYEQIIADESESLVRHLLRGESDPWMFHQANIRDLGGGASLFTDLLDAVLAKYRARATFPVMSPTMDELAGVVKARMAYNASGVEATLEPGGRLTVRVTNAATVPVTGLCTPGAEAYAGQKISYLQLAAGQSVTVSLADCAAVGGAGGGDTGPGGTGTQGHLSTDGGISVPRPDDDGCSVSGRGRGGAGALLIAFIFVGAAWRRLTTSRRRFAATGRWRAATQR